MSFVDELHAIDPNQDKTAEQDQIKKRRQEYLEHSIRAIKHNCNLVNKNTGEIHGVIYYEFDENGSYVMNINKSSIERNLVLREHAMYPVLKNGKVSKVMNDTWRARIPSKFIGEPSTFKNELIRRIKELGFVKFKVDLIDVKVAHIERKHGFFGYKDVTTSVETVYFIYVEIAW